MSVKLKAKYIENFFIQEAPGGSINGSNTAFTLAFTPVFSSTVQLFLNGLFLTQGTDYTISGLNITMTVAPVTGQILRSCYIKR